jgi:hypothetical protein
MQFVASLSIPPSKFPSRETFHGVVVRYRNGDKEVYRPAHILRSSQTDLYISYFGSVLHLQEVIQWTSVES